MRFGSVDELERALRGADYLPDHGLATAVFLALQLRRPLLLEGEASVGKTEVAKTLASLLNAELIRFQCYEGIDASQALYEWDYARQLLYTRALPSGELDPHARVAELYAEEFLVERPLLRAIRAGDRAVLLIDELDRADDEFEAFLLEILSDYTVTVPELGTIGAAAPPAVVVTSNRTRELHDALKRRCLYHWIEFPEVDREVEIIRLRAPEVPERLARSVAEAIDWARASSAPRRRLPSEVEQLVRLGNLLRQEGLRVGTGAVADFCRAASLLPAGDLYWAGRATLVSHRDEIPVYDRVFRGSFTPSSPQASPQRQPPVAAGGNEFEDEPSEREASLARVALASRRELLRRRNLDSCTAEELQEIAALAAGFARSLLRRRSRRHRAGDAGPLDLRRTLHRSLRSGGEPFERRYRTRTLVQRPVVILLDVSGSMAGYAQALLVLAHAVRREHRRTQVFCFGTRLTDATHALSVRDPDEALRRAAEQVVDWHGGTRIGEALKEFLARAGHRGAARGAIVVVCSDGLDVGDPQLLRTQMERISRLAHRVVWLNPLKQDPAYEPLARGMAAALTFVDVFASGQNLAGLEAASKELGLRGHAHDDRAGARRSAVAASRTRAQPTARFPLTES